MMLSSPWLLLVVGSATPAGTKSRRRLFFFFKQKTAYELRPWDWSSDVCSSDLDPLLISGWGPFPRLGVEGAATASVMVRGGGFLIGAVIALRRGLLRLGAPDWRAVPTIFRVGAPLSLAGVLLSLIYMWLTRFTSRFGTPALAALGVGHKVEGIGFMAISGFALSASALVGQNLGARQEARD